MLIALYSLAFAADPATVPATADPMATAPAAVATDAVVLSTTDAAAPPTTDATASPTAATGPTATGPGPAPDAIGRPTFQYDNDCAKTGGRDTRVTLPFDVGGVEQPTRRRLTRYIHRLNCSSSIFVVRRFHRKIYDLAVAWSAAHAPDTEVVVEATKYGRAFRLPSARRARANDASGGEADVPAE